LSDEEPAWPPTAVSAGAQANLEEAEALLAALALLAGERKRKAAFALADLLNRRGLERPCEVLVQWARENSRKSCSPAAALPQAFRLRA
jgi:hypothetical protein